MKINKDAIAFFYRIFFSCYIPCKIYEDNEKIFKQRMAQGFDMEFDDFCDGLQEWESRKKAIVGLAKQAGKDVIDKEVLAEYFGGMKHTEVVIEGLREEKVQENSKFYFYSIFNHTLMPIKILEISQKYPVIIGIYENEEFAVKVSCILFYENEREDVFVGKTVLCHYPMIVDANPNDTTVKMLLSEQKKDVVFMDAVKYFRDGVNHANFPLLTVLRKRMNNQYRRT